MDILVIIGLCYLGFFLLILLFVVWYYRRSVKRKKLAKQARDRADGIASPSVGEMDRKTARRIYAKMDDVEAQYPKISALADKYFPAVSDYVGMRYKDPGRFFRDGAFRTNEFYLLNFSEPENAVSPYIEKDRYPRGVRNRENEELTAAFLNLLVKRIAEEDGWEDPETLKTCLYFILRNGIVRCFAEEYGKYYTSEDLETICREKTDEKGFFAERDVFQCLYVCRLLYEEDIRAPLYPKYAEIGGRIDSCLAGIREKRLEEGFLKGGCPGETEEAERDG